MNRLLRIGFALGIIMSLSLMMAAPVFAQSFSDIFNNNPVNYDAPFQIGGSNKSPYSIDECLKRKQYFFNEVHNIWVTGMERCEINSKGLLSKATYDGISTDPADEQRCVGKRDGQILVNGVPSESEALRWSERCSYLGTVGGAGPLTNNTSSGSNTSSNFFTTNRTGTSRTTTTTTRPSSSSISSTTSSPSTTETARSLTDQEIISKLIDNGTLKAGHTENDRIQAVQKYKRQQGSTAGSTNPVSYTPVYTGKGVQVPDPSLVAGGISKEQSLIQLIVFYTNATLPYVSVLSVFAFVAAGLFYILSFTNEELNAKAKTIMIYVVIGIVIIFSAYTIVNTLLSLSSFQ